MYILVVVVRMIYNFYLFDKNGVLLYYHEWERRKTSGMTQIEEGKLMYGALYTIKTFTNKLSPTDSTDGFQSYTTSKYKLHQYETLTGLKLILNTDTNVTAVKPLLQQIYSQIYVEYCIKNPFCKPGEPITSELFKTKLDELVRQSNVYTNKG